MILRCIDTLNSPSTNAAENLVWKPFRIFKINIIECCIVTLIAS